MKKSFYRNKRPIILLYGIIMFLLLLSFYVRKVNIVRAQQVSGIIRTSPNNSLSDDWGHKEILDVLSPDGGEIWRSGETRIIKWDQKINAKTIQIYIGSYMIIKGIKTPCRQIINTLTRIPAGINTYKWQVVDLDKGLLPDDDHSYWDYCGGYGSDMYITIDLFPYGDGGLYRDKSNKPFFIIRSECEEKIRESAKYIRCSLFEPPKSNKCKTCPDDPSQRCEISYYGLFKIGFNCPNGDYHYSFCTANPDGSINFDSCIKDMKIQCSCL